MLAVGLAAGYSQQVLVLIAQSCGTTSDPPNTKPKTRGRGVRSVGPGICITSFPFFFRKAMIQVWCLVYGGAKGAHEVQSAWTWTSKSNFVSDFGLDLDFKVQFCVGL
jgi:hypothetical protein